MPEHGIEDAGYSNLPGPEQMCILYCLCGFNAWGETWESAGAEMDEHLLEASDALLVRALDEPADA